jgi:hypothetical protein
MLNRIIVNWVYGGFMAGLLLLVLMPLLTAAWSQALTATFLLLPIYMLHQYEEHDNDRFRLFFNATIGKGQDVLSSTAVFITNVPGVWGVIGLSLYLAAEVNVGWAFIAVYLVLVNAFVHLIHAFVFRGYNPGLGTALALFIPSGAYALRQVENAGGGAPVFHAIGLVTAIAIHAAILLHVRRRLHVGH